MLIESAIVKANIHHNHVLNSLENISKSTAEKIYTYKKVREWLESGRLKKNRLGEGISSKIAFKLADLEKLYAEDLQQQIIIKTT